jgi:hypothetical protein
MFSSNSDRMAKTTTIQLLLEASTSTKPSKAAAKARVSHAAALVLYLFNETHLRNYSINLHHCLG